MLGEKWRAWRPYVSDKFVIHSSMDASPNIYSSSSTENKLVANDIYWSYTVMWSFRESEDKILDVELCCCRFAPSIKIEMCWSLQQSRDHFREREYISFSMSICDDVGRGPQGRLNMLS